MNDKLWYLIKTTLIEKDGGSPVMGSIKRWLSWILASYAGLIIICGLLPGGSIHLGAFLNLNWSHSGIDKEALKIVLAAIGTYVLGGATVTALSNTVQNFHNVKYGGNDTPPATSPQQ